MSLHACLCTHLLCMYPELDAEHESKRQMYNEHEAKNHEHQHSHRIPLARSMCHSTSMLCSLSEVVFVGAPGINADNEPMRMGGQIPHEGLWEPMKMGGQIPHEGFACESLWNGWPNSPWRLCLWEPLLVRAFEMGGQIPHEGLWEPMILGGQISPWRFGLSCLLVALCHFRALLVRARPGLCLWEQDN